MKDQPISVRGYAKINLHLDITGRRSDGYHTVNTVMQTISLCDTVTVSLREDERFFVTCNMEGVPTDEKNLAVKAALLLRETLGKRFGANIDILKKIPMAAGLAGGSADAAATLVALNRLLGTPYSLDQLCDMGSTLGADVPFCIVGGTRFADGKGEILHPFPKMPECSIVIACEGEGVSTPWAYRRLDEAYGNFEAEFGYQAKELSTLETALKEKDLRKISRAMYNIFESCVLSERPIAAEIRSIFLSCGALGAMMSGSGPSVFGIFLSEDAAKFALQALEKEGYQGVICHPIDL